MAAARVWHDGAVGESRVDGRDARDFGDTPPTRRVPRSAAALSALVMFVWGLSLLFFDWARRELFEPRGEPHLVLVVPFFGGALAAAIAAVVARHLGRQTVGGLGVHRYGIASGLLGLVGAALLLWVGPSVHEAGGASRDLRAVRQMELIEQALEQHREERGFYPEAGGPALHDALVGPYLAESFPLLDPWGRPFVYEPLNGGLGYLLVSTGRDGIADLPLGAYLDPALRGSLGDDLVVVRSDAADGPDDAPRARPTSARPQSAAAPR